MKSSAELSPALGDRLDPELSWAELTPGLAVESRPLHQLSPAEQIVAAKVREGLSNKEIAIALGKAPATVKAQVASILHKLEVKTRGRLIAWLYQREK